jgi:hypothetical protein
MLTKKAMERSFDPAMKYLIGQKPRYKVAPFSKITIFAFRSRAIWVSMAYLRSKILGAVEI